MLQAAAAIEDHADGNGHDRENLLISLTVNGMDGATGPVLFVVEMRHDGVEIFQYLSAGALGLVRRHDEHEIVPAHMTHERMVAYMNRVLKVRVLCADEALLKRPGTVSWETELWRC